MPIESKYLHATGIEKLKGHCAMALFAALIAGSFSFGHIVAPQISPVALTTARFLIASAVMSGLGFALYGRVPIITKSPWRFFLIGGLTAFYFVTMFQALQMTSAVSTGAMVTLIPLMSAFFGWFLLRQRTGLVVLISLITGASGAVWVMFRGDLDAILQLKIDRGELIFFFGCVAYALYAPLVRLLNRGEAIFDFTLTTIIASTICMGVWGARSMFETDWVTLSILVWGAIAYLAIFATAGTFFLIQFASMRLPASKVMAYGYLTPGIIVFYEWLLGHGIVKPTLLLGVLVITGSLLILARVPDN